MNPDPVGVVLAGGRSRRFGSDKALWALDGESLAVRAARRLARICPEVLVADRGRDLAPEFPSIADGAGAGPAAGLLGAAIARPGRALLVLACDLPAVPISLLEALAAAPAEHSLVPRHGGSARPRPEPLCALYRPAALELLARRVAAGLFAMVGWVEDPATRARFLEGEDLLRHGAPEEVFLNLNRPEDLDRLVDS